jgi:hypothetical protein
MNKIRLQKNDLIVETNESNQQKFIDDGFSIIHNNSNPKRVGTVHGKKVKKDKK